MMNISKITIIVFLLARCALSPVAFRPGVFPNLYWRPTTAGYPADVEILALTPAALYAGTWGQGLYRSTDHGESWVTVSVGITVPLYLKALAVAPHSPTLLLAGDYYHAGLWRSPNDGLSWTLALPEAAISTVVIDPISPTIAYLSERDRGVFKSTDAGVTWSGVTNGLTETSVTALAVDPVSPTIVYAGAQEHLFRTDNGGGDWGVVGSGLPPTATIQCLLVHPVTPSIVLAGTHSAGVWASVDDGAHFTAANGSTLDHEWITDLEIGPEGTLYTAGWSGQVYRSADLGASWEGLGYLGYVYTLAAHLQIPGAIFAGTSNHGIFRGTVLGGFNFAPISSPQWADCAFTLTITATDVLGFPLTPPGKGVLTTIAAEDKLLMATLAQSFEEPVMLTDTTGTITPTVVTFTLGVAQVEVALSVPQIGVVVTAALGKASGNSDLFDVFALQRV